MKTKQQINREYYETHRKVKQSEKICEFCGSKFIPNRSTKKTCSDKCRKALSRKIKAQPQPVNPHYQSDWVIGD